MRRGVVVDRAKIFLPRRVTSGSRIFGLLRAHARGIAKCEGILVWGSDPALSKEGFDRLRGCLLSSGFIRRPVSYEECVDNTLARQVLAG